DHSGGLPEARLVAETPTAPKKADPKWAELKTDHSGGLPEVKLVAETPVRPKREEPRWTEMKAGPGNLDTATTPEARTPRPSAEPHMVAIQHTPARPEPTWTPIGGGSDAPQPGPTPAIPAAAPVRHEVSVVFRPTWNPLTEAVDTHCCIPCLHTDAGAILGEDVLAKIGGTPATIQLDRMMVAGTMSALVAMGEAGTKGTLVLPIHFSSLKKMAFDPLLAAFSACPDAVRLLSLVIEVIGIPPLASPDVLMPGLELVRPLCRDLILRTSLNAPRLEGLVPMRPYAVGADLTEIPASERARTNLPQALARFKATRLPIYLWGAQRRQEVLAAVDAGAMVNGSALLPELTLPRKPMSVTAIAFKKMATAKPGPKG
ncbi:MAG: hypothetical protein H7840_07385, partial [Alphaproteobacteria bacterium]